MEAAGDVIALGWLRPVFKYGMGLAGGVCLGALLYYVCQPAGQSYISLILFLVIGSFIGYFAGEMLLQKSFRVFHRGWGGFFAVACLLGLMVCAVEFDWLGFERRLPEMGTVESVSVGAGGWEMQFREAENIEAVLALHGDIIAHKEENESLAQSDRDVSALYLSLQYALKGGETLKRAYTLYFPEPLEEDGVLAGDYARLDALVNSGEALEQRKCGEIPVSAESISYAYVDVYDPVLMSYRSYELTAAEAADLYAGCILPDTDESSLGRVWLIPDETYAETAAAATVQLELSQRSAAGRYTYDGLTFQITMDASRTLDWFTRHGYTLYSVAQVREMEESRDTASPEAIS